MICLCSNTGFARNYILPWTLAHCFFVFFLFFPLLFLVCCISLYLYVCMHCIFFATTSWWIKIYRQSKWERESDYVDSASRRGTDGTDTCTGRRPGLTYTHWHDGPLSPLHTTYTTPLNSPVGYTSVNSQHAAHSSYSFTSCVLD